MRKLYIFGLIALAAIIIGLAWADQMTFTTYYPAPYGVYREMVVAHRQAIGDVNGDGDWDSDDMAVSIDGYGQSTPIPGSLTVASNVGIGTASPEAKLHIIGTVYNTVFEGVSEDQCFGPHSYFRRARGTLASKAIVQEKDYLGAIHFEGYDGSNFEPAALILATVDGMPSDTGDWPTGGDMPGALWFYTRADDDKTWALRMKINNQGNVGIGTAKPKSKLHVAGLPVYADNAAAKASGLTVGAFYRTGDLLKVVH